MDALQRFNALSPREALEALARCCGARAWAERMSAARPFMDREALFKTAERVWFDLRPEDWLEAFSRHPKIGDKETLREKFASTAAWAKGEQKGAETASEEILEGLAAGNKAYENMFGHIFIVCATGKSAGEMLANLNSRLGNSPALELRIAAAEQGKITRIRLEKLLKES